MAASGGRGRRFARVKVADYGQRASGSLDGGQRSIRRNARNRQPFGYKCRGRHFFRRALSGDTNTHRDSQHPRSGVERRATGLPALEERCRRSLSINRHDAGFWHGSGCGNTAARRPRFDRILHRGGGRRRPPRDLAAGSTDLSASLGR